MLQNFFLYNLKTGLEKIDIKFSEHSNKKKNNNNHNLNNGKNVNIKTRNKSSINSLNEKIKKNLEFGNKIPLIDRLKNEIIYGLKVNQDGNLEKRNMNQILGFKALDNIDIDNENNIKKKERERSLGKGSLQKELNNNTKRNKNKSINYKINNQHIDKNENLQKKYNEKNINGKNNKIVYQNDTLYNFGIDKNKNEGPKFLSYGVSSINENKINIENKKNKIKNEPLLQKIDKSNINYPTTKESQEKSQQDMNTANNNKYGNIEIMLDSAVVNNSKIQAQLYDSIEEESCLANNVNSTIDGYKLDEKIIKLDLQYNKNNDTKNIINNDLENSEIPEFSDLINGENKGQNRPYTPPLTKLVPINQSEIIEPKDKQNDIQNPNNISYAKNMKDFDDLIFDEIKGCYYNPKTNIYYDIKNIE